MTPRDYARWLAPIAAVVLVGGWILAIVAYLAIGTQTCTSVQLGIAGQVNACTDTTTTSVVLAVVIGFAATIGSLFLFALRFLLISLSEIEENTHPGR